MRGLPTVRGQRIGAAPSFPERRYTYGGDQPYVPPKIPDPADPQCGAKDCDALPHAKGYCDKHYRRFVAYGTPYVPDRRTKEYRNASNGS